MTPLSRKTRILHWLLAIMLIGMFIAGQRMGYLEGEERRDLARLHGSFGMIVLVLGTIRLINRFREGWPEPVSDQPRILEILASLIHHILLLVPIILPLSGLCIFIAGGGPITLFGFEIFSGTGARSATLSQIGQGVHGIVTKLFVIALALHIAGALKHHFIDKDSTLTRMLGLRSR